MKKRQKRVEQRMTAVYLDYAATTPMHPEVIKEMTRVMTTIYGNPSSIHRFGRQAHFELEEAREIIARSIHAKPDEIIFNSGGTEGDNTIIIQTALSQKSNGMHIITTNVEHSAVNRSLHYLEEKGFEVTYLPVDKEGHITCHQVQKALRDDTILVTMMFGNNETGNLYPIQEVGELLASHQAYFHTDAVQAFGTERLDVVELQVDYLSVSAHKINGPKGVGFAYVKKESPVPIMMVGGEQEEKKRAGTENLAGIVGLAKAVTLLSGDVKKTHQTEYRKFKHIIIETLDEAEIEYQVNGDLSMSLSHILNVWIKGVPSNKLLLNLDLMGFAISAGSACSAGNVKPSPVIQKLHPDAQEAAAESIRMSFGYGLSEESVRAFSETLVTCINRLNKKMA